ncbi:MAG: integrase [Bryobacterales bacterium]|nr:integrase [Bryobacterales bacterium]
MTLRMENLERLTLAEMEVFLETHQHISWSVPERESVYKLIEQVLKAQGYGKLSKGQKGIVRRFLVKVTGLSRAQVTRWIQRFRNTRRVKRKAAQRPRFRSRYTAAHIAVLAQVDAAHQDLSGPAVRHLCQRGWKVYGDPKFERLAAISPSHLYNLRQSAAYGKIRVRVVHTQARQVSIGERRRPEPQGRPGYIRVDTVHQGQHDGRPGVHHLNAVDTVPQWEVLGCTETIGERCLIPVLEAMLHQFPFRILGFHCDNGSEFLHQTVVKLLNKLLVEEFTKSRAYRTTDNAVVEGKNGAVVRKHMGYRAIGAEHAETWQKFYTAQFNRYLNFHCPCGFATITTNARGRKREPTGIRIIGRHSRSWCHCPAGRST